MKLPNTPYSTTVLLLLAVAGCKQSTINPTGTWSVTIPSTNSQARHTPQTLKLKIDGGALSGTLTYNSTPTVNGQTTTAELPITEAKLEGRDLSFNFTHPPSYGTGPNASYCYQGKIAGDTIKGTFVTKWQDQTHTRDWEAERVK